MALRDAPESVQNESTAFSESARGGVVTLQVQGIWRGT
jgi:hypothetical protein